MPAVVPAATVIVPSGFIVIEPLAGVGAAPGVRVTFPPIPTVAAAPFSVSLPSTVAKVAPAKPLTAGGASSTASMGAAPTVVVTVVVSQLAGFSCSQIW